MSVCSKQTTWSSSAMPRISMCGETVGKEALHVLTGIDSNGYKEVLDFGLFSNESSAAYREMLRSLQSRGLEQALLFVSDGLVGLPEAVTDIFPKAKHQSCWTHLIHNSLLRVRSKDKEDVASDLKRVYKAENPAEEERKLDEFVRKWGKTYPKLATIFKRRDNHFSFMAFLEQFRFSLYTNNLAESLNKSLKRTTKVKEKFPKEDAQERCVCNHFMAYNAKAETRGHRGYAAVYYELGAMLHA